MDASALFLNLWRVTIFLMSTQEGGELDCFDANLVVSSMTAGGKLPRRLAPQSVAENAKVSTRQMVYINLPLSHKENLEIIARDE